MRISDWSSDVCSSDLARPARGSDAQAASISTNHSRGHDARANGHRAPHACDKRRKKSDISVAFPVLPNRDRDRKSVVSGKSVSVRVDLGGRRSIKKKNNIKKAHRIKTGNKNSK